MGLLFAFGIRSRYAVEIKNCKCRLHIDMRAVEPMLDPIGKKIVAAMRGDRLSKTEKDRLQDLKAQYELRCKLSRGPCESRSLHHAAERRKVVAKIEAALELVDCSGV